MNYLKSISLTLIIMLIISSFSFAQEMGSMKKDSMKTGMMKDDMMQKKEMMHGDMMMKVDKNTDGVAIKGYDPVGYFTDGKPVMGDKMYSHKWMGAEWHFKSKEHLNMFMENPEKYAPQYGGFCAYGVSHEHLAETDPNAWSIVDGKLYLNYNTDVKMKFEENLKNNIMKAEENWPELNKENGM